MKIQLSTENSGVAPGKTLIVCPFAYLFLFLQKLQNERNKIIKRKDQDKQGRSGF